MTSGHDPLTTRNAAPDPTCCPDGDCPWVALGHPEVCYPRGWTVCLDCDEIYVESEPHTCRSVTS